ncbi:hypothetical protein ACC755_09725 [Rhizobium ruizarguesonis]|uniref:hypothetical protein n=1 Tax=Rhizobium ruizarguesonis TaxID=2081791 RepID=UPI001FE0514C|nr:hypothetical protein [Rhizobium ruizarguesonis]
MSGPRGYRVAVVDYDVTANALYQTADLPSGLDGEYHDPFLDAPDGTLLSDPRFHAQNVYAVAMRILARFEFALGRRVQWGCEGHQLNILPHAFAEPNAFYSRDDRSLFFGYFESFPDKQDNTHTVFSCLSHDVIAHETTHAILDGLRSRYLEPSSPDQGAFHEGLADVVALLSVFALPDVVGAALDGTTGTALIDQELLEKDKLANSVLFRLADEMGQEMSGVRGRALRHSIMLPPGKDYMNDPDWQEVHKRGELLVAAMLRSRRLRADEMLRLVRILDNVLNNTSLILLFRCGSKSLLFPGDAQIENWSYALSQAAVREKLKKVDLYKVGHHGSLNATPKSLWDLFDQKSDVDSPDRLQSLMSTMAHKHGDEERRTEVPRQTLVQALDRQSAFFTTQSLKENELFHETSLDLS